MKALQLADTMGNLKEVHSVEWKEAQKASPRAALTVGHLACLKVETTAEMTADGLVVATVVMWADLRVGELAVWMVEKMAEMMAV